MLGGSIMSESRKRTAGDEVRPNPMFRAILRFASVLMIRAPYCLAIRTVPSPLNRSTITSSAKGEVWLQTVCKHCDSVLAVLWVGITTEIIGFGTTYTSIRSGKNCVQDLLKFLC